MDIIGKLFVENIFNFGLALVVIAPISAFLYSAVRTYIKKQKESLYAQINLITDVNIRKLVADIILNIEKAIGSEAGIIKFEKAKAEILKKVPDLLDPIVEKLLQGVFDELKSNKKV